jgi:teichoic acid transport system ATP-binding protein
VSTDPTVQPAPAPTDRKPVVIVDDVHVEYNVFATGKRPSAADRRSIKIPTRGKQMRTVHALKGVSFTAYENDSIGVIGTNGSGKSTLMRAIAGLTPTSDGAIYSQSRPSLLGVGAALLKDLSGQRNIILGGLAMGFTKEEVEARYDDVVAFAGLEKFIDLPMRAYSSGMTARLKFAIASMATHEILIVDEALAVSRQPLHAVDPRHLQPGHLARPGHPADGRRPERGHQGVPRRPGQVARGSSLAAPAVRSSRLPGFARALAFGRWRSLGLWLRRG